LEERCWLQDYKTKREGRGACLLHHKTKGEEEEEGRRGRPFCIITKNKKQHCCLWVTDPWGTHPHVIPSSVGPFLGCEK
jgi:hypothetical protein